MLIQIHWTNCLSLGLFRVTAEIKLRFAEQSLERHRPSRRQIAAAYRLYRRDEWHGIL